MKRLFCLLLFLCLLPFCALANVDDFSFLDEWKAIMLYDNCYAMYELDDCFKSQNGKITAYLRQDGERPSIEFYHENFSEPDIYHFIPISAGRYILYAYDEKYGMYTCIAINTEPRTWFVYDDTSTSTALLTEDKVITESGSLNYAIYGSNFYAIKNDTYLKCPITLLSDDIFMIKAEESTATSYIIFIRSTLFDQ